jgi:hypothetical protein
VVLKVSVMSFTLEMKSGNNPSVIILRQRLWFYHCEFHNTPGGGH